MVYRMQRTIYKKVFTPFFGALSRPSLVALAEAELRQQPEICNESAIWEERKKKENCAFLRAFCFVASTYVFGTSNDTDPFQPLATFYSREFYRQSRWEREKENFALDSPRENDAARAISASTAMPPLSCLRLLFPFALIYHSSLWWLFQQRLMSRVTRNFPVLCLFFLVHRLRLPLRFLFDAFCPRKILGDSCIYFIFFAFLFLLTFRGRMIKGFRDCHGGFAPWFACQI